MNHNFDSILIRNYLEEQHYDVTEFAGSPHTPIPNVIKEDLENHFRGISSDEIASGWYEFCESGVNRDDED